MVNCGLCGRPIYNPGEVICSFCKKASSRHKSKNADRMNRRQEQEQDMYMNIAFPGKDEEESRDNMRYEHYVDSHDASAVWADDGSSKKGRRRR